MSPNFLRDKTTCISSFRAVATLLLLFVLACGKEKTKSTQDSVTQEDPLIFTRVDSNKSGINFKNTIKENVATLENLFNFDYFYNGAGVGVGDINNDGLLDIFFCGNQVENKLYLNKGNLQFEDISESAGINEGKVWSNGIAFVDINNDGWLDFYVSQGGPNQRLQRKNLLYINQKNNTFVEKAEDYGLADMGISTQSAFFDYDKDGDLDCIVMNENEYYGVDPVNLYRMVDANPEAKYFNSSHFYRNDNGQFTDVTKEVGIERPIFGLGLSVSDINNDGWLDFYIASDYYIPDALFINERGKFKDKIKEFTNQISYYGMGIDIADINGDTAQDIFVLDMASSDHKRSKTLMASMSTSRFEYLVNEADFHYQYMFNSLQLNMGQNKFNNIAQMTEMANTDWSWSVLMSDYDLDGDNDIYVTNGYRRYALDNDLQNKVFAARQQYGNNVPLQLKQELYDQMPSEKLPNLLFENEGELQFSENGVAWGLGDYTFSNGMVQGDLDNDGDYDLVVNNMDELAFVYQNNTIEEGQNNYLKVDFEGSLSDDFPKVSVHYNDKKQFIEVRRIRGYRSSHENIALFGLSDTDVVDTLRVEWPNGTSEERYGVKTNQSITINYGDAKPSKKTENEPKLIFKSSPTSVDFVHKENNFDDFNEEILLPYKQSTLGPFLSKGDVNGDGLVDFYIGNASGRAGSLYLQSQNGFKYKSTPAFETDRGHEDMESTFFDLDNDGDLDLYVVSGGYEFAEHSSYYTDRIYLNDGQGNFTKLEMPSLAQYPKSGKTVAPIDFDNDGDIDLLVGNRTKPRKYPQFQPSTLYENQNGTLIDVTESKAPQLSDFGIVNKVIATDYNNDGNQDIIAVGEWTGIGFFRNNNGRFELDTSHSDLMNEKGWWYSIKEIDLNDDGRKDYIVGNVGHNIKFKASHKKPFKIYSSDFDGNGSNDIVLSKQYQGEYVPVRGRECSSQQMPFIKEKFKTYSEFANASLVDIYGENLEYSYQNEANNFSSVVLIGNEDGSFTMKPLPVEAQMFPILAIETFKKEGEEFIFIGGNIYETEVETPRLDAFSGFLMKSDSNGQSLEVVSHSKTGLLVNGNLKDAIFINSGEKSHLILGLNNDKIKFYELVND